MFKQILVAVDLSEVASNLVLERAVQAANDGAKLDVLHVVEPQYIQYSMDPTITGTMTHELENAAIDTASEWLQKLCEPHGIPAASQHIRTGRASTEIHTLARDLNADLIVIGSHGYHGWRRILGSTANAVLHGTPVHTLVAHLTPEQ